MGGFTVKAVDVLIALGDQFNKGQESTSGVGEQERCHGQLIAYAGHVARALAQGVPELFFKGCRRGRSDQSVDD